MIRLLTWARRGRRPRWDRPGRTPGRRRNRAPVPTAGQPPGSRCKAPGSSPWSRSLRRTPAWCRRSGDRSGWTTGRLEDKEPGVQQRPPELTLRPARA